MEKQAKKNYWKLPLKIALTLAALYLVYIKIDLQATLTVIAQAHMGWLLLALLLFVASKVTSAYRLNRFFRAEGLLLPQLYNLRLYFIGMFYNLFLPGGIGGDGYKVYLLNKHYKHPVKGLLMSVLIDRLSGLVSLGLLAQLLFIFSTAFAELGSWQYLIYTGLVLAYPISWLALSGFYKKYLGVFHYTNLQSLGVQGLQVLCAWCILAGLGVEAHYTDYTTLFLVSSVVAVLPFTIGGIGARELVFIYGVEFLLIEESTAVAFSILFFVTTALSSLSGAFLSATPGSSEAQPTTTTPS